MLVIPTTMLLQIRFEGAYFSAKTISAIVLLIVGVAMATVTEVRTQLLGSLFAMIGVLSTSIAQIVYI